MNGGSDQFGANLGYPYSQDIFPMNNGELFGATNRVSEPSNSELSIIILYCRFIFPIFPIFRMKNGEPAMELLFIEFPKHPIVTTRSRIELRDST